MMIQQSTDKILSSHRANTNHTIQRIQKPLYYDEKHGNM